MGSLVSVVIPTYGRARYINRAIESALSQVGTNVEVIVVDDNGVGTSEQIAVEEMIANYVNGGSVRYIAHMSNANGSAARNTGIEAAAGDYVAFLDDDDWFHTEKLALQVARMKLEGAGASLCGFSRVTESGVAMNVVPLLDDHVRRNLLAHAIDTCAGSCLVVERNVLIRVGLFDVSFVRHQDLEFLYRIARETVICVVPELLTSVFMHSGNQRTRRAREKECYRKHYLKVFANDIRELAPEDREFVWNSHCRGISKAYLRDWAIGNSVRWVLRASDPFSVAHGVLRDICQSGASRFLLNRSPAPNQMSP